MKLLYSIKAILKHKVSVIIFFILLIFNCFQMISLIQQNQSSNVDEQISELRYTILSQQTTYESQKKLDAMAYYTDSQRIGQAHMQQLDAYKLDLQREKLAMLEAGVDTNRFDVLYELFSSLMDMNFFRNVDAGEVVGEELFAFELAPYTEELGLNSLPFDTDKLRLHDMAALYSNDQKSDGYRADAKTAEYYLYLLDHGLNKIELTDLSPWSYLANQLGKNSLLPFLSFPLALIFAAVYLYDLRQKQSLKLLMAQGTARRVVLLDQVLALLMSYLLIFLLALAIPTVIIGFIAGWQGLTIPMLVDLNGLQSMKQATFLADTWNTLGLSTFPAPYEVMVTGYHYFMVEGLAFVPYWTVLLLSFGLFVLKVGTAVILGVMSIVGFKKKWQTFGLLFVVLGVYMLSQTSAMSVLPMVNVLTLGSCFQTVQGGGAVTLLNAYCVSAITGLIVLFASCGLYKGIDYSS